MVPTPRVPAGLSYDDQQKWYTRRETMMVPMDSAQERTYTYWRETMKERCPAIYAKYGPFVAFGDVDDTEWAAITDAVEQVSEG